MEREIAVSAKALADLCDRALEAADVFGDLLPDDEADVLVSALRGAVAEVRAHSMALVS